MVALVVPRVSRNGGTMGNVIPVAITAIYLSKQGVSD